MTLGAPVSPAVAPCPEYSLLCLFLVTPPQRLPSHTPRLITWDSAEALWLMRVLFLAHLWRCAPPRRRHLAGGASEAGSSSPRVPQLKRSVSTLFPYLGFWLLLINYMFTVSFIYAYLLDRLIQEDKGGQDMQKRGETWLFVEEIPKWQNEFKLNEDGMSQKASPLPVTYFQKPFKHLPLKTVLFLWVNTAYYQFICGI